MQPPTLLEINWRKCRMLGLKSLLHLVGLASQRSENLWFFINTKYIASNIYWKEKHQLFLNIFHLSIAICHYKLVEQLLQIAQLVLLPIRATVIKNGDKIVTNQDRLLHIGVAITNWDNCYKSVQNNHSCLIFSSQ